MMSLSERLRKLSNNARSNLTYNERLCMFLPRSCNGRSGMDDIVSHKMAADYKVYELRKSSEDLTDLPREAVKPYWEDMFKVRKL